MNHQLIIFGKIVVALLLSSLIGLERELNGKPAGLRTHILVAMSATLLVSLVPRAVVMFTAVYPEAIRYDPLRVFNAIVVGISFMGAGTILKTEKGHDVHHLTTAGSILMAGTIGLTVGLDYTLLAACTTGLVLIVNVVLAQFSDRFIAHRVRNR